MKGVVTAPCFPWTNAGGIGGLPGSMGIPSAPLTLLGRQHGNNLHSSEIIPPPRRSMSSTLEAASLFSGLNGGGWLGRLWLCLWASDVCVCVRWCVCLCK